MARVRLSVAERREELLRAAIGQIEARGVAAVRIADVAAVLGVSNALVLYHFSTKEQLVAAAFAHAAEDDLARLRKLLGRRTTALRRLRSAVRWYAPTGRAKGWRLWIEGWAVALREPALREVARDLDHAWKAALTEVIAEGVAAREFHCPDPAGTALRLTALLDGLAVQLTSYGGTLSRTRAQTWVDEALARELRLSPETLGSRTRRAPPAEPPAEGGVGPGPGCGPEVRTPRRRP
ncbi:TetR/AcrR family transcriptional regulator [Streptomyces antibioticus]|uniref:TetR/AcrR family transcriptional regulator n=1 Tax=Streptomyces antibioticus TaxID=1890 RepID=UPI0033D1F6BF